MGQGMKKGARRRARAREYRIYCRDCKKTAIFTGAFLKPERCVLCGGDQIETARKKKGERGPNGAYFFDGGAGFAGASSGPFDPRLIQMFADALANLFGGGPFRPFTSAFTGGRGGIHVAPPAPMSDLEKELRRDGYKACARRYHPDHGGNAEKMVELNRLKDKLKL